jgi:hypothetical protein
MNDPMLNIAKICAQALDIIAVENRSKWAGTFIQFYLEFWRRYGRGLTISISHGVNFFDNVIGCCEGTMKWTEEGEYGNNFRTMIKERPMG